MKKILILIFSLTFFTSFGQMEDAWLFLKDKPNAEEYLKNPSSMVSQKAIERRDKQNISFDEKDVPIHQEYYNQILNEGNIVVLGKSKWLNAIHIQGTENQIRGLLPNFPFIETIEFANKSLNPNANGKKKSPEPNHLNKFSKTKTDFNYGNATNQIKMLNGDYLHKNGMTGNGQIIAVIDAGFPNVNTLPAFKRIRDNNQILGGYNFADRNNNFYTRNNHGTHVLSTIAGYVENQFVGTAPDAKFYLFISEIAETETVLEETLWVEAAERADSLGVDVINTSLGYTTYDNANHSHSYADMDGKTTFITRGAEIGASRGLILVNSVGNSGSSPWKYMGAPADAPSVISVGAVNASRNIASFSSFGPTVDHRIKPEVLAQGLGSAIINFESGAISTSNGTSFSSPIMAGLIACLNEITYNTTKSEINRIHTTALLRTAIYNSGNSYENPTEQHGYGIPDFEKAYTNYWSKVASASENSLSNLRIYPNPANELLNINGFKPGMSCEIFNVLGKKVFYKKNLEGAHINISFLNKGIYLLKLKKGNQQKMLKLMKQ